MENKARILGSVYLVGELRECGRFRRQAVSILNKLIAMMIQA